MGHPYPLLGTVVGDLAAELGLQLLVDRQRESGAVDGHHSATAPKAAVGVELGIPQGLSEGSKELSSTSQPSRIRSSPNAERPAGDLHFGAWVATSRISRP